jgi:hypothetical protein
VREAVDVAVELVVVKGEVTNRRRELDCGSEYADAHTVVKEN